MGIPFVKMHGLGNDYVFVDLYRDGLEEPPWDPGELSREVSRRRTGIGGDGLILILRGRAAPLRMRIFNADGSEAEMCGNGIRCFAKYVFESGYTGGARGFPVETGAGILRPEVFVEGERVASVRVDMGEPRLLRREIPMQGPPDERAVEAALSVGDRTLRFTAVSMGNPHCVLFLDDGGGPAGRPAGRGAPFGAPVGVGAPAGPPEVEGWGGDGRAAALAEELGPLIERHPAFPRRTNVEFVRVLAPDRLAVEVWERGSGRTAACGTGACAAVVAGVLTGRAERSATVTLPGGDLAVEWAADGRVYLTGPAAEVFRGVYEPR